KDENGVFRDIAHPITAAARSQLENAVLERYLQHLAQSEAERAAVTAPKGVPAAVVQE
ncbi:MAG: septation protein SpoVG family protein, partial [Angelakisella sp.]